MTDDERAVLQRWLDEAAGRPSRACGIFIGSVEPGPMEGDPYQSRARPWDEPDLLRCGCIDGEDLLLAAEGAHGPLDLRLEQVGQVRADEHGWGPGVYLTATISGRGCRVWLV